jgi:hypothetical protein
MDNFEVEPEKKKNNRKPLVWNFLTVVLLLSVCCLAYFFLTIFNNPNSPFNPFPPQPLPTMFQTDTPTSTIIPLASTWTPTETLQPSPSRTKAPTWTPLPGMITPSETATPNLTPTETSTPTFTATPMPASAVITYEASTNYYPNLDCAWAGVAGKVFGPDGKPLQTLVVQLGGTLDGKDIPTPVAPILSGSSSKNYGLSGFEFVLGKQPIVSTQTLWIQLFDSTGKTPLSDKIYFDTSAECARNLVMVVFTKNR